MAQYDLTAKVAPYLDRHLVFLLLEFLQDKQLYANDQILKAKIKTGPSGDTKFRNGVDAGSSKSKGKGVYQYAKKYGANVDGYSPIYVEEEWSKSGGTYAGGQVGLAMWAVTFAGLLADGAFLVYNTSALA